jgi:hypothetical protein
MILLPLFAITGYSCSCEWPSVRQKFRSADAVFLGKVTRFEELPARQTGEELELFAYQATFSVEKQWKGKKQPEIETLVDIKIGGMCEGMDMRVGDRFLIYAPRKSGKLLVSRNFCSVNQPAGPGQEEAAKDEIEKLDSFLYRSFSFLYPFPKF